jgi:hypothetical protein
VATDEPNLDWVQIYSERNADLPVNKAVHCSGLLAVPFETPELGELGYSVGFAWILEGR